MSGWIQATMQQNTINKLPCIALHWSKHQPQPHKSQPTFSKVRFAHIYATIN
jgi:hypothetical protein